MLIADLVENEGKLLHGRNDDLLAVLNKPSQVAGVFRMADDSGDLRETLDRGVDLLVEIAAVGDDNDGVENVRAVLLQADQLMRQPGNGVAFAAARRMLNKVAMARAA